ncbi:hypothetical protein QQF64_009856 [Cirrhinus molitorella]|uniref:HAT C-terminal dimerisation domain-containing protein n=1 Tax=Cirrhinus molitorella TaxID=172907 RepID=A0ABR3M2B2_9TELE
MIAALRGFTRLNCSAHILNIILSHAFSSAVMDKTPEAGHLLKDVKKLVTYFKHSGLQYDDIATILLENKQFDKVACISKNNLKTLVTFLKPFKDATNDLESDNTALSASLVLPWSVKLRNHCEAAMTDCILSEIASTCVQRLDELMSPKSLAPTGIHMLYKIATFLTPKLRQLKMIDDHERQAVIHAVKVLVDELGFDENREENLPPPAKKSAFKDFAEWEDADDTMDSDVSIDSEIAEYLKVKLDGSEAHGPKDVLQWWKRRCQEFPRLSKLTRHVLCIPASSAPSERAFSICGRILEQRRINLKPALVNDMLFLHGHMK